MNYIKITNFNKREIDEIIIELKKQVNLLECDIEKLYEEKLIKQNAILKLERYKGI